MALLAFPNQGIAQGPTLKVEGVIVDEANQPLTGANISLASNPKIGTATDINGKFSLDRLKKNDVLKITFIGYQVKNYKVTRSVSNLRIQLQPDDNVLNEVVAVGMAKQRKVSVVGAVTTVDPKELDIPGGDITTHLAGVVPGIIATQASGEPGQDFSEFWVRGISTFGGGAGALVLIDGIEGSLRNINTADIESFSILKDASATAVYGVRGANGVILITTKQGKAGRLSVMARSSVGLAHSTRLPNYLESYDYARLANEARIVRGQEPRYTEVELELMRNNLDPDLYPNVNWRDVIMKKFATNHSHYISAQGGGKAANYFISVGANYREGIFKTEKGINKYNTNVDYQTYNFRANVVTHLTSDTDFSLLMDATLTNRNAPGFANNTDAIWGAQANLTPLTVPTRFSNGELPAYGRNGNQISPYVLINHSGYKSFDNNTYRTTLKLSHNFKKWVPGLTAEILASYRNNSYLNTTRSKIPNLFKAFGRYNNGDLMLERTVNQSFLSFNKAAGNSDLLYFQGQINYNRVFAQKHRVGALVHAYRQQTVSSDSQGAIASIPKRYQALSGRATYSYQDIYNAEFNFGITGSENFEPGFQYGFFPSIAFGWVPSQYEWVRENMPWMEYFKIRASYGQVGNDRISGRRFPYLTLIGNSGGRWKGEDSQSYQETQIGANNLRWEVAQKYNLGIDWTFFKNRFGGTIDIFTDIRNNIFQERARLPEEVGAVTLPYTNIGRMHNVGLDGNAYYMHQFTKDFKATVRGNFTFAHNKVDHWEHVAPRYPYQSYIGLPLNIQRGLVAEGLFRDSLEIKSWPSQKFGEVRPGDIKYKDVNGDGKVDNDDIVPISYNPTPELVYGFGTEFQYKKLRIGFLFTGAARKTFFFGGLGFHPYSNGETGNVLTMVNDQRNRWTPAWYSGDPATENPNARFPRLSYGNSGNNNRPSTFWHARGDFLRWKNVDISYDMSNEWLKKVYIQHLNLRFIGENLLTFDGVKLFDPEQAQYGGLKYPIQRQFTFQVTASF